MRRSGFTLIEMMVVILILFVFSVMAVPMVNHVIKKNRRNYTLNSLMRIIQLAHSEAIKRGFPVSVCPSLDLTQCSKDWSGKIVIFVNKRGKNFIESEDEILQVIDPLVYEARLVSTRSVITLFPVGRLGVSATRVFYCPDDKEFQGALVLSNTGRVRLEKVNPL